MKALFTKDCLDWVGHLIIQATIWKQRSKLKAKCGLLRKKLLVCVLQILLHACIFQSNVVFCSCKAKAKWSRHALYTFNLTFNYIKCVWGNISVIKSAPSFISKSASSKKKEKKKGQSAIMWSGAGDASDFLHALSQRRMRQSASALNDSHKDAEVKMPVTK